ncbi:MAG TPA: YidB family protein [Chthoniobacterales bacterium]|nr:YidB family protein [Chthoniobacterales bacterium]
MGLLDSLLGDAAGKATAAGGTEAAVAAVIGTVLTQNGGVQGLMNKFSQGGLGGVFSSWVSTGENQAVSASQLQNVLGSEQVQALAAKLGVDPATASGLLAQFLPKVVDKLTPTGQVDPNADHQQGLAALLPSLLQELGGQSHQP